MFGNKSRANAVFIVKVSAKIPVGYTLKNGHNAHGTDSKQELLTSMAGTGKYETYIFKETCGSTGTFSTINHLYLSGPVKPDSDPLEWFVDYATVFDLTADGYGDIEYNAKDDLAQQLGYSNFDKMVENASKGETIIKGAYINTKLIDVETLVADTALVDKLTTRILTTDSITAKMISVGGFEFEDGCLISSVFARSSSFESFWIDGYTALILSTYGVISFRSRCDLLPNSFVINSLNPITY